jgi:hypothetical protein
MAARLAPRVRPRFVRTPAVHAYARGSSGRSAARITEQVCGMRGVSRAETTQTVLEEQIDESLCGEDACNKPARPAELGG